MRLALWIAALLTASTGCAHNSATAMHKKPAESQSFGLTKAIINGNVPNGPRLE